MGRSELDGLVDPGRNVQRYLPRVATEWGDPNPRWREVDGSLVFVDISGFTSLSERLTAFGHIGAEELTDVLNRVFGAMLDLAYERGGSLLDRVGLGAHRNHRPAKLSGGQQQRVAVARGLASDPPMLLADEPTANLDYIQAEGIISLLRGLRSDGRLIIVSTHDDRLVPIADRVVHLVPGHGEEADGPHPVDYLPGDVIFEQGTRASSYTSSRSARWRSSAAWPTARPNRWPSSGRASTSGSSVRCSASRGRRRRGP